MRVGHMTLAYQEERFIGPHLDHVPIEDKLLLLSTRPWHGDPEPPDRTEEIAREHGAHIITGDWLSEEDQRNTGLRHYYDYDWVVMLDPDEFLLPDQWERLFFELERATFAAYRCERQYTYWKTGYVIEPPEPCCQFIAVKPQARIIDRRDPNCTWGTLPIEVHHFSWARTDAELRSKITHFGHAHELLPNWYEDVWSRWTPEMQNLHPMVPDALKQAVPCELPAELEGLWPATVSR